MCPLHLPYAAFFIIRRHRGSSVSLKFWVVLVFFTLHLCHWTYFNSTKHLRILKFLIIYWLGMHLSGWQCYTVSGIFLWLFWAGTDGEGGCGLVVTKLQLGRDVWVLQLSNVEFTEHPVHEITSLMKNLFYGLFHDQYLRWNADVWLSPLSYCQGLTHFKVRSNAALWPWESFSDFRISLSHWELFKSSLSVIEKQFCSGFKSSRQRYFL